MRYCRAINDYLKAQGYNDIAVMIAFSGAIKDPADPQGPEYTESGMNRDSKGNRVSESQTKAVFHEEGNILVSPRNTRPALMSRCSIPWWLTKSCVTSRPCRR